MDTIKNYISKHKEFFLSLWLVISIYICQLMLFIVTRQAISFQSFVLDFLFYVLVFMLINLITNPQTRKTVLIFFFCIFSLICVADSLYASYYHNYAAINVVTEIGNVAGGAENDMGLRLIPTTLIQAALFALGLALIISTKFLKPNKTKKSLRLKALSLFTLISCLTLYNYSLFYQIKNKTYASSADYYLSESFLYDSLYSSKTYVKKYGYINFRIKDLIIKEDEESIQSISAYFNSRDVKASNGNTGAFEGYNVINVLSETLDTKIITYIDKVLKANSDPSDDELVENLIPTYYSMFNGTAGADFGLADSGSLVFENYYVPQFATGSTINSEFMSITGLYPYFNRYWCNNIGNHKSQNTFSLYSLPAQLNESYNTYYAHANVGSFYNRSELIPNFGFENYYFSDTEQFKPYFNGNDWEYDENLIKFLEYGVDETEPFYISFLTYSMHLGNETHYPDISSRATALYNKISQDWDGNVVDEQTNAAFKSYLCKYIYFDNFLKELLEWVESNNVGKTIINIYPDHYNYGLCTQDTTGKLYEEYLGVSQNTNEVHHMALTTFITDGFADYKNNHYSGEAENQITYSQLMATIDLAPTILNWLDGDGETFEYRYFFGNDYFDNPEDNYVYFADLSLMIGGIEYNINGEVKKMKGYFTTTSYPAALVKKAQNELANVLTQLKISKSIINSDFFAWLKLQQ